MAHSQNIREKKWHLVAILLQQDVSPLYAALLAWLKSGKRRQIIWHSLFFTWQMTIYEALLHAPSVTDVVIERYLGDVRPDVSFVHQGELKEIEVQISTLSLDAIERRTEAYARRDIAVLWTPPLPMEMFEYRYAPRDWERYLHTLYYRKVYYWSQDLLVQPVQFEEYMIPPSWYSDERRSKRFVTPVMKRDRTSRCLTWCPPGAVSGARIPVPNY